MASIRSGLCSDASSPRTTNGGESGPEVIDASESPGKCHWPRQFSREMAEESGLSGADVAALDTVAESLFRSGLSDDRAAELFDRVFGWALSADLGVDIDDEVMGRIRARRAS